MMVIYKFKYYYNKLQFLFFMFREDSPEDDMIRMVDMFDIVITVFPQVCVVKYRDEVECEDSRSRESPDDRPCKSTPDRITRDDK